MFIPRGMNTSASAISSGHDPGFAPPPFAESIPLTTEAESGLKRKAMRDTSQSGGEAVMPSCRPAVAQYVAGCQTGSKLFVIKSFNTGVCRRGFVESTSRSAIRITMYANTAC